MATASGATTSLYTQQPVSISDTTVCRICHVCKCIFKGSWVLTEPIPRDLRQHCGLYGLSDQRRRSNHAPPYSLCCFSICTNHARPYSLCCFSTYTRCLNCVRAAVLKWGVDRCTASFSDLITAAVDEDATRQRQNLAVSGDFHAWNDQRGVDRTRSVRQERSIRRSQQYDLKHGY